MWSLKTDMYIYQYTIMSFACLSVTINVKTAEPIGPKCFVTAYITPVQDSGQQWKVLTAKLHNLFLKIRDYKKTMKMEPFRATV